MTLFIGLPMKKSTVDGEEYLHFCFRYSYEMNSTNKILIHLADISVSATSQPQPQPPSIEIYYNSRPNLENLVLNINHGIPTNVPKSQY